MYTIFNIVYLQACKMDDLKTLYLLANSFRWGEECQASSPQIGLWSYEKPAILI